MIKKKVIIDCDPGHDDIMAIFSCLANPEIIEVLGYTTVCGNNLLDKVTSNLGKVLRYLGLGGIIAKGYDSPLVYPPEPQPIAHGESGLDGPILPEEQITPISLHAIEFMKQMCEAYGSITIIAIGPLTNVAMFLKTYPHLKDKIENITFMGGSRTKGNIIEKAEFNIYEDPHAAKIVFEAGIPLVMSGLEICGECMTPHAMFDALENQGKLQHLAFEILNFFRQYNKKRGIPFSPIFDLVPVMHILHPELFETEMCNVKIEVAGQYTRGMTVFDEVNPTENANVLVLSHCNDVELYNKYFFSDLKKLEEMVR